MNDVGERGGGVDAPTAYNSKRRNPQKNPPISTLYFLGIPLFLNIAQPKETLIHQRQNWIAVITR